MQAVDKHTYDTLKNQNMEAWVEEQNKNKWSLGRGARTVVANSRWHDLEVQL